MTDNMFDLELYNKTKSGVEYKLLKRKKTKKRVTMFLVLFSLFVGINTTVYALSIEYRNWLSLQLGLTEESTINVEKNIVSNKINMEVLSYYRVNNTVVMSISFKHTDEKEFTEDLNIEYFNIDKSEDSSGEILSSYSYRSEDRKYILVMLTMNVESEKIKLAAENLISMVTGECVYSGNWELEVDVSKQTGYERKIADTNAVSIQVKDKEYSVKEIYEIGNALFFKCDTKQKGITEEEKFSSVYGGNVILEYEDGTTNDDYYCIPDKEDNLVLLVWDINQLNNISQIYIDGEKILR